jgi:hypothetical protein
MCLEGIPPWRYDFVGLPLELIGADGSPLWTILLQHSKAE